MPYKPTGTKWQLARMALFAAWPGLPIFALGVYCGLSQLHSLLIAAVIVAILDWLVERLRQASDADGE